MTQKAEELLRINQVDETTSVRYLEIPDQLLFDTLWELGLFREINRRLGSLIDDYEEEFIEATSVGSVLAAVDEIRLEHNILDREVISFLTELSKLSLESLRLHRPLLFVL